MTRRPKLKYVKWATSKGHLYAYFNTGKLNASGNPIYTRLPDPASPSFHQSYAAALGARNRVVQTPYLIKQLVNDYQKSLEFNGKKEGTRRAYETTCRKVVKLLGDFPVNDLRRDDLMFVLETKMAGAGSHNLFLAVMGVLYTYARKSGKTDLEPTKDIDKMEMGEHEAWPGNAVTAGLTYDGARMRLAIHLLYYTGQRIGDVCKMRWTDITDGRVFVVQQKTGKRLDIALHSALKAELDATPKQGLTILARADGTAFKPRAIRDEIKAFGKTLGLDVVPHGLRKNAVISLLEAGCTIAEASAITGQTYQVVEYYARQVNQRKLGDAAILKFENKAQTCKPTGKLA